MTEVGLLLGIRENWPASHEGRPIEQLGAAIADGNGGQAVSMAVELSKLGYAIALYRDSDVQLTPPQITELAEHHIPVFEYGHGLLTDRKSVVSGKRVSVSVDLGCRRIIQKKKK